MKYPEKRIKSINDYFQKVNQEFINTRLKLFEHSYKSERANEFFQHGFMRRYYLISHCIERIFEIYPPSRTEILKEEERGDITAFLQVIYINIYGAIDNLAWIVNFEKNIGLEKKEKGKINLFNKEINKYFTEDFNDYLKNNKEGGFKNWYDTFCKDFRHSLGHRIPLYVPPFGVDINNGYTKYVLPMFTHSYIEDSKKMFLHEQILCDFALLTEIINKFVIGFKQDEEP